MWNHTLLHYLFVNWKPSKNIPTRLENLSTGIMTKWILIILHFETILPTDNKLLQPSYTEKYEKFKTTLRIKQIILNYWHILVHILFIQVQGEGGGIEGLQWSYFFANLGIIFILKEYIRKSVSWKKNTLRMEKKWLTEIWLIMIPQT